MPMKLNHGENQKKLRAIRRLGGSDCIEIFR
jgi:hypothetical protein